MTHMPRNRPPTERVLIAPLTARPDSSDTAWVTICRHVHGCLGVEATTCGCAITIAFLLHCLLQTIDGESCLRILVYKKDHHAIAHTVAKQLFILLIQRDIEELFA
jgi:hypothetical protein